MLARTIFARKLATAASQQAPKRESTFMRVWASETAAYPIIFLTLLVTSMGTYKVYHAITGPEYHFNRSERRTLDYLENDRDVDKVKSWSENTIHKTPEILKDLARGRGYIDLPPAKEAK
jgi:hypothetical protein